MYMKDYWFYNSVRVTTNTWGWALWARQKSLARRVAPSLKGHFSSIARLFLVLVFWCAPQLLSFMFCLFFIYVWYMKYVLFQWIFLSIYQLYPEHFCVEYVKLIYAMILYLPPGSIKNNNIQPLNEKRISKNLQRI